MSTTAIIADLLPFFNLAYGAGLVNDLLLFPLFCGFLGFPLLPGAMSMVGVAFLAYDNIYDHAEEKADCISRIFGKIVGDSSNSAKTFSKSHKSGIGVV